MLQTGTLGHGVFGHGVFGMKDVLVIGGTRFFGRRVVEDLAAAGHRVVAISRGNRPCLAGAEWLRCDRKDRAALAKCLSGRSFDAVIDNICYQPEEARAVLELLGGRCGRYILTSTVMTYLDALTGGRPVGEEDWAASTGCVRMCPPYLPGEVAYATAKRACETEALARADLSPIVFRLHNVVGEDDFSGKSAAIPLEIHRTGGVRLKARPDDTYQQVYAGDLGRVYREAVERDDIPAAAYNVAGARTSVADYLSVAMTALEAKGKAVLGEPGAPDGPYPVNVSLDDALFRRAFRSRLAAPAEFLPAVCRWYAARDGTSPLSARDGTSP